MAARITYEHRLIDDMVASALKWSGGYVWACKELRWRRAIGHGRPGLWVARPDDLRVADAGWGRPSKPKPRMAPSRCIIAISEGPARLRPIRCASIFCLDTCARPSAPSSTDNEELARFAATLEKVCIDTVESGFMTKDLALLVGDSQKGSRPTDSSTRSAIICAKCLSRRRLSDALCSGYFGTALKTCVGSKELIV